jgi:hypothetical protein
MKKSDAIISRTFQGAIRIRYEIAGVYETRDYFEYTVSEAWSEFKNEFKGGKNPAHIVCIAKQ